MGKRDFGTLRRLPSGRWQSRYRTLDGSLATAPTTFASRAQAVAFLSQVQADRTRGVWVDPRAGSVPFGDYAASWNGTAPLDASSGDQIRHRLSRAGNRQINRTLHIMATVQLRNPSEGRAYYDRKKASGKTSMESMRCLKRRLSDIVYRHMVDDAVRAVTGPGGHRGAAAESSATGSHPHTGSSGKSHPGPATLEPTTVLPAAS